MPTLYQLTRTNLPTIPLLCLYGSGVVLLILVSTIKDMLASLLCHEEQPRQKPYEQRSSPNEAVTVMGFQPPHGRLLSAATYRGGKLHNEDSYLCRDFGPYRVLVIADGVSSSDFASTASRTLTQVLSAAMCEYAARCDCAPDQQFVLDACSEAARQIAQQLPSTGRAETTLIVLLELPDRYRLVYLGDGGAVRIRGNLRDGKSLLLAHHDEYGRLSGYVSATGPSLPTLSTVEFSKSNLEDGDILLVGTDGALPPRRELVTASALLRELFDHSKALGRVLTPAELERDAVDYLVRCNPDDNATLGILFSSEAFDYWQSTCSQHSARQGGGRHDQNGSSLVARSV